MWWGFGQREAHQRDMYGLWWRGEEEDTMAKGADLFSWRGSPQTMQLNGLLFLDFGEMLEGSGGPTPLWAVFSIWRSGKEKEAPHRIISSHFGN
jgi:hypothetical protein